MSPLVRILPVYRSDCFSSDIFVGCMDTLLVEKEARMEAANLVGDMHSHARFWNRISTGWLYSIILATSPGTDRIFFMPLSFKPTLRAFHSHSNAHQMTIEKNMEMYLSGLALALVLTLYASAHHHLMYWWQPFNFCIFIHTSSWQYSNKYLYTCNRAFHPAIKGNSHLKSYTMAMQAVRRLPRHDHR